MKWKIVPDVLNGWKLVPDEEVEVISVTDDRVLFDVLIKKHPEWVDKIRADERAKVIDELKSKFTRKGEDGNLYIFAWYVELEE